MSSDEYILTVPQGRFCVNRLPKRARELLKAYDAADEYLLRYVAEQKLADNKAVLILNDSFGALAVALSEHSPYALSDSFLSQQATRLNLETNRKPLESVGLLTSLTELPGSFDLVLIKIPKTLALLEDQLLRLKSHIHSATQIVAAGMVKNMPATVWRILESLLGTTQNSLAKKKARLIFVTPNNNLQSPKNPYPVYYQLENTDYLLANHANVFSRDSLDIGTRFFLQHLPIKPDAKDIIDLGCGNGVVGLLAAQVNPAAMIHFIDESFMALASAEENFRSAFGSDKLAEFLAADGLATTVSKSADLILCNPPFHQQMVIGDSIAVTMFKESHRVLRENGELWVIGNRHLNYQHTLKRFFKSVSIIATNPKFIILKAMN